MGRPRIMRVGVDLDGTLTWAHNAAFLSWMEVKGFPVNYPIFESYGSWEEATGLNGEELSLWYARFYNSTRPKLNPTPGAVAALERISLTTRTSLITARGESIKLATCQQITDTFSGHQFHRFFFGCNGRKGEVMRAHGIPILIEDSPHEAMRVVSAWSEATVIAMPNLHAPWPQNCPGIIVPRILKHIDCRHHASQDILEYVYATAWQQVTDILQDLGSSAKRVKIPAQP